MLLSTALAHGSCDLARTSFVARFTSATTAPRSRIRTACYLRTTPDADVSVGRLRLAEEEVPRDGAVVTRRYQLARTPSGDTAVWVGRCKRTGEGEGWSGLRLDTTLPPGG